MMVIPPLAISQEGGEDRLEFRSDGKKAVTPAQNCPLLFVGGISERWARGGERNLKRCAVCG